MNAMDKVRTAIVAYEGAEAERLRIQVAAENNSRQLQRVTEEVIRQMRNVCPGKIVYHNSKEYRLVIEGEGGATLSATPSTMVFLPEASS